MLKARIKSFGYAGKGIVFFFKSQPNAKIHAIAAILAIGLGGILNISKVEWVGIILAIGAVLTAEAINTALEELVNWISPEYNTKAGIVKDVAAGAVLITALTALVIGGIIFLPKILALLT
ncbi:diacylglycerol kinase [marine bacterium AO1-C]|nr:diacylglycerol kinase [marine bacterium AO1-C]